MGGRAGGGGGRAGGLREPETQAAQPSAQELTETATVGIDDGKGRGGHREVISPAVTITALKTSRKPYHVETSVESVKAKRHSGACNLAPAITKMWHMHNNYGTCAF